MSLTMDDRDGFIWLDGKLVPWRESRMHVLTHALHYGSAVFEGERIYDGRVFRLSAHSARLIRSGRVKRAIVGGVDSLAKYTVNGFNALKILSESPCKPFDVHRDGLNLGEGGAYLVLEAEELTAGKKVYAEIAGFGNANDAHHPSAMSEQATGAIRCMREAIGSAGIQTSQIGYVNAHGTGTQNNDQVEFFGMRQLFGQMPPYSSTKSFTGHTLGAAGAVEAIFSILGIMHSELFPSLNVAEPISGPDNAPVCEWKDSYPLKYVLSNSFGFGGNCTSLVFGFLA